MSKCRPENERVKREYSFYLEAANGKQSTTVDAALRTIDQLQVVSEIPRRASPVVSRAARRGLERARQAVERGDGDLDAQALAQLLPLALA
jgi:hypothetical protein